MIHLRVRTEYSFGATFAPLSRIVERFKATGVTAAGIVDLNSTWGHIPWHKAMTKAGIQPLLGVDLVVVDNEEDPLRRMWFLAKTTEGLTEMYRFTSKAHTQKVATRGGSLPRLYTDDVRRMSKHIAIFAGDVVDRKLLKEVRAIIDFNSSSRVLTMMKRRLAEETGLRLVETGINDFAFPEDRDVFEFASRAGLKTNDQFIPEKLTVGQDVAKKIAKECAKLALKKSPMIRAEGDLEALCRAGIKARGFTKKTWTKAYEERLRYELDLIRTKDFDSYFIVVADMVRFAKERMLVGPSRGSSAGSLVCYLARITEIDPLPVGLFFERFIDVTRTDLPDIDLDFPDDKRHLVFEYMAEKYGSENVAHIGTVARFKPKSALIQVCKALNIPPTATASVKVAMIERGIADSRFNNCLEDTFKDTVPGREFIEAYPQAAIASRLEGHATHTGVHAAGLLVSNDEITNYATVDADGIAHLDKNDAEAIGLLKIDVLGLRTLGVLEDSGIPIDWYGMKFDDPATFEVFNSGRHCGIFQFEGNAMRSLSQSVHFKTLVEVDAVTALARPGPFASGVTDKYIKRHNGAKWKPIHPKIDALMSETFGLPLYQEHTLAIVREIGQFGWEDTSFVRKGISKRQGKDFFARFFDQFLAGARKQGIPDAAATEVWELINAMGAWQMNKAHTYSYAVISYWTAFLKAHHPLEFAAANLRNARGEDLAIALLREMVAEGFEYIPFDLEHSAMNWSVRDGKLLGGFLALKGIGESKAARLIAARDAGTLTAKDRANIEKAENVFADIFPFATKYGDMYENPADHGIATEKLWRIAELEEGMPHHTERVFLGEIIHKSARNRNEEVLIKKRGGKKETGQLDFVDVRLRDDSGQIGGRIGHFDYLRIGRELLQSVPIGAHILVRAKFFNGIRFAFITKWKRLDA